MPIVKIKPRVTIVGFAFLFALGCSQEVSNGEPWQPAAPGDASSPRGDVLDSSHEPLDSTHHTSSDGDTDSGDAQDCGSEYAYKCCVFLQREKKFKSYLPGCGFNPEKYDNNRKCAVYDSPIPKDETCGK